jgi:uncharacterized membrane protein
VVLDGQSDLLLRDTVELALKLLDSRLGRKAGRTRVHRVHEAWVRAFVGRHSQTGVEAGQVEYHMEEVASIGLGKEEV